MAGVSLLALLDDITSLLDDVATMTKVAAKKTAGVLGDDLALNARQVSGVLADRELPVVWAVAKGSFVNKAILIPAALLISHFFPWLITPLLMVGGAYLCFEGAEKVVHHIHASPKTAEHAENPAPQKKTIQERTDPEKAKISGAIRTDFILSAEIIVISLGAMPQTADFVTRALALCLIGVIMTAGVYGFVACIVKLDDAGLHLLRRESATAQAVGRFLLGFAPWLMRFLSIAGTVAMFLVGGSILSHGLPWLQPLYGRLENLPLSVLSGSLLDAAVGLLTGLLLLLLIHGVQRLKG